MFNFAEFLCQPISDFFWIVFERPVASFVGNSAGFIHDVQAFRPGGVKVIHGVGHIVHAEGNRIVVALREIVGDGEALLDRFWLHVTNIFLDVGFHLPLVSRVRFANVDGQEICVVFVVVEELYYVAHLATEGWSSKAAKDKDQRLPIDALANLKMIGAVECGQAAVRSCVSNF